MLALHTSDWHLGRALHGHDLSAAQAAFVDHLVDTVRAEGVDLVLVSGDVHDRAIPPVPALRLFDEALSRLRDTGATVVVISGNHDAAARLGDKAGLLDPKVRIRTDPAAAGRPVVVEDATGPVRVYAVPYLEPAAAAALLPAPPDPPGPAAGRRLPVPTPPLERPSDPEPADAGGGPPGAGTPGHDGRPADPAASHAAVLRRAMAAVRADLAGHGGRAVVCAHAWVTGGTASDSERDIGVGGVAAVPAALFDGITYTALGHLHRPQALRAGLRYSGSPLPYSFSEAGDAKASLLVEIGPAGLGRVERVPAPVYRRMTVLRGRLADLMADRAYDGCTDDFVSAVLTDPVRPLDAMVTLQRRFPHALALGHEPAGASHAGAPTFAQRTRGRSDLAVAEAFVSYVRTEPSEAERGLLTAALDDARRAGDAA
jgi:exonuclease SbcD